MIDVSNQSMLTPKINSVMDAAIQTEHAREKPRNYLGGSRIGVECERALQFEFFNTPKDPGKDFDGRILRVFERGHWIESAVIRWMRLAGVEILTEDKDGKQFGFSDHGGRMKGHCDGIIVGGPAEFGPFPRLWECKGLQAKDANAIAKHGLRKEKVVYFAQCQIYMHRFGLTEHPALLTVVNADRMELHWEAIKFEPSTLKRLDAKAAHILSCCLAGELLPRLSQDPNFYRCKWCSWGKRCFSI